VAMAAGSTMTWYADGSVTNGGFVICPTAVSLLSVTSGSAYCSIDSSGCVTDGIGDHGNSEACTVTANHNITVSSTYFNTEPCCDRVIIGAASYGGTVGPSSVAMAAGSTMTWYADGSVTNGGFVICPTAVDGSSGGFAGSGSSGGGSSGGGSSGDGFSGRALQDRDRGRGGTSATAQPSCRATCSVSYEAILYASTEGILYPNASRRDRPSPGGGSRTDGNVTLPRLNVTSPSPPPARLYSCDEYARLYNVSCAMVTAVGCDCSGCECLLDPSPPLLPPSPPSAPLPLSPPLRPPMPPTPPLSPPIVNPSMNATIGIPSFFRFTARDDAGSPIVSQTYDLSLRVEKIEATLSHDSKVVVIAEEVLPVRFIGNELTLIGDTPSPSAELPNLDADSGFSRREVNSDDLDEHPDLFGRIREFDGTFEVTVVVEREGPHTVSLTQELANKNITATPWTVTVYGHCPSAYVPDGEHRCQCKPGSTGEVAGPSTNPDNQWCTACGIGFVKREPGRQPCETCFKLTELLAGSGSLNVSDPARLETAAEGATSIDECLCRDNYFLADNAQTPQRLRQECPRPLEDGLVDSQLEHQSECCSSSNCKSFQEQLCLARTCRERYITANVRLDGPARHCQPCPQGSLCAGTVGVVVESLPLDSGWWRTNELSTQPERCHTAGACLNSDYLNRTKASEVTEWLCAPGHHGALCEVCLPDFFRNDNNRCVQCGATGLVFDPASISRWLPLLLILSFLVLALIACCCMRCLSCGKRVLKSRQVGRLADRVDYVMRSQSIWIPKLKILISMAQVQEGLIPTFGITLPEILVNFLELLNVWRIDLPLDCIYDFNFHSRLAFRTLLPLFIMGLLYLFSRAASRRKRVNEEAAKRSIAKNNSDASRKSMEASTRWSERETSAINWLFFVIFLEYPGCSAMVFATFGCHDFDDGTSYLMADYSIDCASTAHAWMKSFAFLMMLIWPIGVPCLYLLVLGRQHKALTRIRAIELAIKQSNADGRELQQSAERAIERERLASYSTHSDTDLLRASPAEADEEDDADWSGHFAEIVEIDGITDLYDGTALRTQAQTMWEKTQPVLGIDFAKSDAFSVRVGRVVWPTFELIPALLTEESYHLVDLELMAEGHNRRSSSSGSPARQRRSIGPGSPLKRASSALGSSANFTFASAVVSHLKNDGSGLASAEEKIVDDLVQAWGAAMKQEVEDQFETGLITEKGREKQLTKVQAEIDSLARTASKSVVLVTVLEQELARMAYWAEEKESMSSRATKRATRTSRQTPIMSVDSSVSALGKAHQKPAKPDKETAAKIAEDLLLNKDWQRMPATAKASYLPRPSRMNQPLPNDVILSVDGSPVTTLKDAEQKLAEAGHGSDGLVRLQVLRSLEWRELHVSYVVDVTVKKKLVFKLTPSCALPTARLPCCVGSRMALRSNSDAAPTAGPRSTALQKVALPGYTRALTNQYNLFVGSMPVYCWEVFECLRKLFVVGLFFFFGRGTIEQLIIGLLFCIVCLMIYNNVKPYAAWENDVLQQLCQLNISFTLLVAIVIRFKEQSDPMTLHNTENTMAWLLLSLTILSAFTAFALSLEEAVGDGIQVKKNKQRAFKAARGLRKRYMRNIAFVAPKYSHNTSLTTSMLFAEELGGVPYCGKADVASFLQELNLSPCKEWSAIPAEGEHSVYARVKHAGSWWMATIPKSEMPSAWIELQKNPRFSRSQKSLLSVVSDASLLSSVQSRTAQAPSCAAVSAIFGERQEASAKASMHPAPQSSQMDSAHEKFKQRSQMNKSGSLAESAGRAHGAAETFAPAAALPAHMLPPPPPAVEPASTTQTPAASTVTSPIHSIRARLDGVFSRRKDSKDEQKLTRDVALMQDLEMADQSDSVAAKSSTSSSDILDA